MKYEILNDDLFEEDEKHSFFSKKKHNKKHNYLGKGKSKIPKIILYKIYFLIFLFTFLTSFLLYSSEDLQSLYFFGEDNFYLRSDISNFETNYAGDLLINTNGFILESNQGKFNSNSNSLLIEDFVGQIKVYGGLVEFLGKTDEIKFDENTFEADKNEEIKISFTNEIKIDTRIDSMNFLSKEGYFKVDKKIKKDIKNSDVLIDGFVGTLKIGKNVKLKGKVDSFILKEIKTQNQTKALGISFS